MTRILAATLLFCLLALLNQCPAAETEPQPAPQLPGQYKRIHQAAFKDILDESAGKAREQLQKLLRISPDDTESLYMLSVAHAKLKQEDEAVAYMQRALQAGLPSTRFVAGTLTGLESLRDHPSFKKLAEPFAHQVAHGPMLGCITGDSVRIWVRTVEPASVQAVVRRIDQAGPALESAVVRTELARDNTVVVALVGLQPETEYRYRIRVNGQIGEDNVAGHVFRTFPAQGKPGKFRLAFGGGAGFVPSNERAWETIRAHQPDVLLLLGDNVYSDDPQTPAMQHYCYYRRQSRPEFRKLVATTPVYSIWDDHDFGTNDCQGGPDIEHPVWKRPVWNVFRNNWVNPGYGGGEAHPGCYYDFYLADVHFIMLDGRYYRDRKPADGTRPTMLGPVQRAWLFDTIRNSRGSVRVLCSPVPWVLSAKGKSKDTWNGFREERDEIFRFLHEHQIDGVVLMSADRHRSDLWKIEREAGYPLYEFNSSRLTNQHVHAEMKEAVFSYNKKQSFGLVDVDTTIPDPTLTYRIVTIDGEEVFQFVVHRSELSHAARQ